MLLPLEAASTDVATVTIVRLWDPESETSDTSVGRWSALVWEMVTRREVESDQLPGFTGTWKAHWEGSCLTCRPETFGLTQRFYILCIARWSLYSRQNSCCWLYQGEQWLSCRDCPGIRQGPCETSNVRHAVQRCDDLSYFASLLQLLETQQRWKVCEPCELESQWCSWMVHLQLGHQFKRRRSNHSDEGDHNTHLVRGRWRRCVGLLGFKSAQVRSRVRLFVKVQDCSRESLECLQLTRLLGLNWTVIFFFLFLLMSLHCRSVVIVNHPSCHPSSFISSIHVSSQVSALPWSDC